MLKKILSQETQVRLLILAAFCMPVFVQGTSVSLGILAFLRLVHRDERKRMLEVFQSPRTLLLSVIFYLLYVIGLGWTTNFSYAGLDLGIKASFLLFPFIVGTQPMHGNDLRNIKFGFASGCMTACLIMLVNAGIQFSKTGNPSVFFYTDFSQPLMHPTYLSMYLSLALLFGLERLDKAINKPQALAITAENMFLAFNLVLLSARMAMITAVLVVFVSLFRGLMRKSIRGPQVMGYAMLMLTTVLFFYGSQRFSDRFAQVGDAIQTTTTTPATEHNSATGRLEIWKESITLLESNWMFGTGTGDVKDELIASYARNNFEYGYSRKLNSHNQFLQTWLTLGIPGILVLIGMFLFPLTDKPVRYRVLFFYLAMILSVNALTESILEVQRGVIFMAFFFSLFLNRDTEKLSMM